MTEPFERELAVFSAARRLAAAERAAYLDQTCAGDAALRRRVEELLRAGEDSEGFLQQPAPGAQRPEGAPAASTLVLNVTPGEKAGDRVGHYKLLQQIGEGGCGLVYMAEQEEPVRRRVALKVIKLGMDTKSVIARFEAERQALAMMDHPNIAKVFEAGATETGRPYFVMELVKGIKITDYCDQNNLSTKDRLDLFIQVCQAVQHAHQKGIIHRDLKPSNILVTSRDGVPVPKVIDFGIAKATTDQPLTDKTLFTAFEQFLGTPAYMSPEQAEMSELGIDTRSDIYSLGVLLYELLTGKTPFDAEELLSKGLDAMRRTIREQEPERPSTRLSTMLEGELTTTAKHRHTESIKLVHSLCGDLDWIVMKALEKDRARRYETVSGLANDVQRHLNCEPVVARPPSKLYEFQKTVRRHKFGFAAAGAVGAALLIGLAVSMSLLAKEKAARQRALAAEREQGRLRELAQAKEQTALANERKAQTEAAKSDQTAQFLKDMLQGVGPSVALGRDTTLLREILDKTAHRVAQDLGHQPDVQIELSATLADTYHELAEYTDMERMAREALRVARSSHPEESLAVADALGQLGDALMHLGVGDEAETCTREAIALERKLRGGESVREAAALYNLASVLRMKNDLTGAEEAARQALAMRRRMLGGKHLDIARSLDCLSFVLRAENRLPEAETAAREALAMRKDLLVPDHPDFARSFSALGELLAAQGKLAEAETMLRESLAMRRKLFSPDTSAMAQSLKDLVFILRTQGKLADAQPLFREEIQLAKKAIEAEPNNVHLWHALGELFFNAGEWQAAIQAFERCNQISGSAWQWFFLAMAHLQLGNQEEAHKWFYKSIGWMDDVQESRLRDRQAEAAALLGLPNPWERSRKASTYCKEGDAYRQQGKMDTAKTAYGQAISYYETLVADFPHVPAYRGKLVSLLTRSGRSDQAKQVLREMLARSIPARDPAASTNLVDLSSFYNAPLTEDWHEPGSSDLSELPRGIQTFAGVQFDVRGLIQLSASFRGPERYPDEVRDIPVHRTCRRLHFLHAAIFAADAPDGAKIGSYIVHYASGKQSELPIIMGKSLADWWTQPDEQGKTFTIGWQGENAESRRQGRTIRLFKSTWENPAPGETVSTIDFIAFQKAPAPFLVAITVEP
jgi:serine/threonine protein kinase/tetratricopeptide (TPR) repeat protein